MKKADVFTLANRKVMEISTHCLDALDALKVIRFRKEFKKAVDEINEEAIAIQKECGIEDPAKHDNRIHELVSMGARNTEQEAELNALNAASIKYLEMLAEARKGEIKFSEENILSYENWRKLSEENRDREIDGRKYDILSGIVEDMLEDVLFKIC